MAFQDGKTIKGWGVVRNSPWHLVGIFDSEQEALAERAKAGPDYVAAYGEGREGADEFIWSEKLV